MYFEYSIPRLGRRIDVVALLGSVVFVLEFKVGETEFTASARDQVWDYSLDLKNFHEPSHHCTVAPIVVATNAEPKPITLAHSGHNDGTLRPLMCNAATLSEALRDVLRNAPGPALVPEAWEQGQYHPTPTIIEAATALYKGHNVTEISRSDAAAINLSRTSDSVSEIIRTARDSSQKAICFVTGVPGAGKTLVGLNIATQHISVDSELYSVFLSGNGPLVDDPA